MVITKAQRQALKRIYDRVPLYHVSLLEDLLEARIDDQISANAIAMARVTYRQFRKQVRVDYDYIMVRWCGMWLAVEKDGYTHS